MEIPLYQLFHDGIEEAKPLRVIEKADDLSLKDRREAEQIGRMFLKLDNRQRGIARTLIARMAK